jgi:hypothetical protein
MVVASCSVIVDDMTGYGHADGQEASSCPSEKRARVTTPGHMTVYRRRPKAAQSTVPAQFGRLALSHLRILSPETFGPPHAFQRLTDIGIKGEIKCSAMDWLEPLL